MKKVTGYLLPEKKKLGDIMKFAIVTNSASNILEYKKIGADAFIFGLKGYSSGYNNNLTLEEIEKVRRDYDGELFIAVNKNIFNGELKDLESALVFLDKIKVDGILFYDLAVLSIRNRLGLKVPLVWNQTHMVTNYNTCNYFYDKGCNYGVLASEITLDEINEIKSKTSMKLFLNIFGYQAMGYTRRHLVDNYFKSTGKERNKDNYIVKNNDSEYIVSEEEHGNAFYFGKVLNGSVVALKANVDYLIFNDNFIDKDIFSKTLSLYKKLVDSKDDKYVKEIDALVGDNRGFFFNKTIYKVKKDE